MSVVGFGSGSDSDLGSEPDSGYCCYAGNYYWRIAIISIVVSIVITVVIVA